MNRWMAQVMREGVRGETDQMLLILSCGLYTAGLVVFGLNAALRERPVICHHLINLRHLRLKCCLCLIYSSLKGSFTQNDSSIIIHVVPNLYDFVRIGMT